MLLRSLGGKQRLHGEAAQSGKLQTAAASGSIQTQCQAIGVVAAGAFAAKAPGTHAQLDRLELLQVPPAKFSRIALRRHRRLASVAPVRQKARSTLMSRGRPLRLLPLKSPLEPLQRRSRRCSCGRVRRPHPSAAPPQKVAGASRHGDSVRSPLPSGFRDAAPHDRTKNCNTPAPLLIRRRLLIKKNTTHRKKRLPTA